jgi:hypothetical protein
MAEERNFLISIPVSSILATVSNYPSGWLEDCSCKPSIFLMGDRRLRIKL